MLSVRNFLDSCPRKTLIASAVVFMSTAFGQGRHLSRLTNIEDYRLGILYTVEFPFNFVSEIFLSYVVILRILTKSFSFTSVLALCGISTTINVVSEILLGVYTRRNTLLRVPTFVSKIMNPDNEDLEAPVEGCLYTLSSIVSILCTLYLLVDTWVV